MLCCTYYLTYGEPYKLYSCILMKSPVVLDRLTPTTTTTHRQRTRIEEEDIVYSIVLYALLQHVKHNCNDNDDYLLPHLDIALSMLHDNTTLMDNEDIFIKEDVESIHDPKLTPIERAIKDIIQSALKLPHGVSGTAERRAQEANATDARS
jgi:hypothetical protein